MGPSRAASANASASASSSAAAPAPVGEHDNTRHRFPDFVPFEPKFFVNWRVKMESLFRIRGLLPIVEGKETAGQYEADSPELFRFQQRQTMAYTAILMSLDNTSMMHVRNVASDDAAGAWAAIVGVFERRTNSSRVSLRQQFHVRRMQPGETFLEYVDALRVLSNAIEGAGGHLTEDDMLATLLRGLPQEFDVIVAICKSFPDMTYYDCVTRITDFNEEMIGRRAAAASAAGVRSAGNEEALLAAGAGNGSHNKRGLVPKDSSHPCHWCGGVGHWSPECPAKKAGKPKMKNARENAAVASVVVPSPPVPDVLTGSSSTTSGDVSANVGGWCYHVLADVLTCETASSDLVCDDGTSWIVDSGCSSHMSGNRLLFGSVSPLESPVGIRLADNNIVEAVGYGPVGVLPRVLYVPGLHANLISVSSLADEGMTITFTADTCSIARASGASVGCGLRTGNLFKLSLDGCVAPGHGAPPASPCPDVVGHLAVLDSAYLLAHARPGDALLRWHQRLGHVSVTGLKTLVSEGLVTGAVGLTASSMTDANLFCHSCVLGKSHRQPFGSSSSRASHPLELVHSDVAGPMQSPSFSGARYFITFIDDFSRKVWVYFMKKKSEALSCFERFCIDAGVPAALRTDNGGEYFSVAFAEFCATHRIAHQSTVAHTPQQNGVAERANRTLVEMGRTLLLSVNFSFGFWAEAISTAAYLRNLCSTVALDGITPAEKWSGRKPDVSHLRTFGCDAYVHVLDQGRRKLDPKARLCKMVGYAVDQKAYRLWDPATHRVIVSRDVIFNEHMRAQASGVSCEVPPVGSSTTSGSTSPSDCVPVDESPATLTSACEPLPLAPSGAATCSTAPGSLSSSVPVGDDVAPMLETDVVPVVSDDDAVSDDSDAESSSLPVASLPQPTTGGTSGISTTTGTSVGALSVSAPGVSTASGPSSWDDPVSATLPLSSATTGGVLRGAASVNAPLRRSERRARGVPATRFAAEFSAAAVECANAVMEAAYLDAPTLPVVPVPVSYSAAVTGADAAEWCAAIASELASLEKNATWSVAALPADRRAVGCTWVFKVKRNKDGGVERYKARLCAQGFSQREGVDYGDTFAPVARVTTIRVLLSIAAQLDFEIEQMDVCTAFLNGELEEDIFMRPPPGLSVPPGTVLKLHKGLYGLKQSPRVWNHTINAFLLRIGFVRLVADPCVYVCRTDEWVIFIALFVDDLILVSSSSDAIVELKCQLHREYDMTDLGAMEWCLGMLVTRDRSNRVLTINQSGYLVEVLTRFNMESAHPGKTPADPGIYLPPCDMVTTTASGSSSTATTTGGSSKSGGSGFPFKEAVGCLLYAAMCTRPDITNAVCAVSRFSANPSREHWGAVKNILKYVVGTTGDGLVYGLRECDKLLPDNTAAAVNVLIGFCDSDWGGMRDTRKSTTGYVFFLNGGPVSWASKVQPTVALSSAEAEYMAAAAAAQEAVWLRALLGELGFPQSAATVIFEDNQACIAMTKNPVFHKRSKHIDIRHHFVRERVLSGEISLVHCGTSDMVADVLTKPLAYPKFMGFKQELVGSHVVVPTTTTIATATTSSSGSTSS